jgi:hypothetical protein
MVVAPSQIDEIVGAVDVIKMISSRFHHEFGMTGNLRRQPGVGPLNGGVRHPALVFEPD